MVIRHPSPDAESPADSSSDPRRQALDTALDTVLDPTLDTVLDTVRDAAGDGRFVSASFSGARRGATPPVVRVTVRPVELNAGLRLQFSEFDGRTTTVTNLPLDAGLVRFAHLLEVGFGTVYVKTLTGDLQLTHSRKGTPRVVRHRPTADVVDTSHDREKRRLVDPGAPFLRVVGITDAAGRIKPTARAKYRQVERFVEILDHTLAGTDELPAGSELHAVDLGCGAGVLTLATYHHLTHGRGLDVTMTGVDTKQDLMLRLGQAAASLGWTGLSFRAGTIGEVALGRSPDLVVALHACDTATDDALARAIEWQATWVLAAPCCQHDLQAQLDRASAPEVFDPLLRHGIVRERLGDLLTDALRAEILRAHGYRTDVIEFVSTEHTAKNLMIRAVRASRPETASPETAAHAAASQAAAAGSAERLAALWHVEPALARRVGYGPSPRPADPPVSSPPR